MKLKNKTLLSNIRSKLPKIREESSDFDLDPDYSNHLHEVFTPAAVLIPITEKDNILHVTMTRRSSNLKNHPSQISFPGGKRDKIDRSLFNTALREAEEEIGLPSEQVKLLGCLPDHKTVTGFKIKPYLGLVITRFEPKLNHDEVEELFTVPLDHLLNLSNFSVESREWRNAKRFYYTIPYGPHYIWGATARIIRSLAEILRT